MLTRRELREALARAEKKRRAQPTHVIVLARAGVTPEDAERFGRRLAEGIAEAIHEAGSPSRLT